MVKLGDDIVHFFENQGCVIVSTLNKDGAIRNSCKGVLEVNGRGEVFLCDLYHGETGKNIAANPAVSVTAIDEHKFKGYCLQGQARLMREEEFPPELHKKWASRIASRITQRVLKNIGSGKGHPHHPEALLPSPKYIIAVQIDKIVDLTPQHLK